MSRLLPFLLAALVFALLFVRAEPAPERLSADSIDELLALTVGDAPERDAADESRASATGARTPLWRALLDGPALRRDTSPPTLRLGRVAADPTAARLAAHDAGALLALPVGPEPAEGARDERPPLWKLVLDGPAARRTDGGLVLRLYGCRASADAAAATVIEDTWCARVSIAAAFRELARTEPAYASLVIEGEESPVKGGANFELQLIGDQHMIQVTVDDSDAEPLLAKRIWRPDAPNDARARACFVRSLLEHAQGDPALAGLVIEGAEAPVAGGLDVRLELAGGIQTLDCSGAGIEPLGVERHWTPPRRSLGLPLLAGTCVLLGSLLLVRPPRRERRPANVREPESARREAI